MLTIQISETLAQAIAQALDIRHVCAMQSVDAFERAHGVGDHRAEAALGVARVKWEQAKLFELIVANAKGA